MDLVEQNAPSPEKQLFGYPFFAEFDSGSLVRHKMNLMFATCSRADELIKQGYVQEAKRLLREAAMIEPEADFIRERIESLP